MIFVTSRLISALSALIFLLAGTCLSFEASTSTTSIGRRECFQGIVAGVAAGTWFGFPKDAQAVISSKFCASGQGEGCEDLAEGNEFIKSLQQKSAANAETYAREARNAYYMKNYPDFFETVGKKMVKKSDGSFFLVDDAELQKLIDDNKITLEIPKAMGGKFTDLTQKPVMVLKD